MRRYRRNYEGQIFFFTLVTHQRRKILTTELGRKSLRDAFKLFEKSTPLESGLSFCCQTIYMQCGNFPQTTTITPDVGDSSNPSLPESGSSLEGRGDQSRHHEGAVENKPFGNVDFMNTPVVKKPMWPVVRTTFTSIPSSMAWYSAQQIGPGLHFIAMFKWDITLPIGEDQQSCTAMSSGTLDKKLGLDPAYACYACWNYELRE